MQLALGMLGGTLLRSSKQHPGGQIRATPFQACTASEPPVLALSVEQAAGPGNAALGPMVRVTVRNVSNRVVPFFWTASPTEIFSATVLGPDGGRADVPEAQDYLYHPLAELPAPKVKNASGLVLTGVVGGSGPMGLALAPGAEATWDWRVGSDFDMTASGTYRLSLGGTLDYLNTTVCSNTIDVTVK
jgi:hypothetical protein